MDFFFSFFMFGGPLVRFNLFAICQMPKSQGKIIHFAAYNSSTLKMDANENINKYHYHYFTFNWSNFTKKRNTSNWDIENDSCATHFCQYLKIDWEKQWGLSWLVNSFYMNSKMIGAEMQSCRIIVQNQNFRNIKENNESVH